MDPIRCFLLEPTGECWYFRYRGADYVRVTKSDDWRVASPVYRRQDTGEELLWKDAPPGAMVFSDEPCHPKGPDGRSLLVRLPPEGQVWYVDGRANNCTMPDDKEHRCWVRHGEAPHITVNKIGNSCAAGGGSILVPGWHGYLRDGYLVACF